MTDLVNIEHVSNRQQDPRSCLVYPVDRFDTKGWFSCNQVIFECVSCVFCKKHAAFKWKYALFGFLVSPGSAEAQARWGGKIKYILIAYFLGYTCAKNYRNWTVHVKIIASRRWDVFLRHGVDRQKIGYRLCSLPQKDELLLNMWVLLNVCRNSFTGICVNFFALDC